METDDPINTVSRVTDSQLIVEDCVLCGETHYHGTGNQSFEVGDTTHRGAHCEGGDGYRLKMTEATEFETR